MPCVREHALDLSEGEEGVGEKSQEEQWNPRIGTRRMLRDSLIKTFS
jgi:hypothetical protein